MKQGKLISLEGSEGAGKSTNITFIAELLTSNDIDFIQTREPGGTTLSEEIRHLLLKNRKQPVNTVSELLLMFASRVQLLNEKIKPALAQGQWVLCDRFIDASYAYQGAGRQLGFELIKSLETMVMPNIATDLTLYVDVDVEVGLQRAGQRSEADRFEQETIDFFQRIREGYLQRVNNDPKRCRLIDGNLSLVQVQQSIKTELQTFIECNR